MHNPPLGKNPNRTPPKPLITNRTPPLLINHHPAIQPTRQNPPIPASPPITQHQSLNNTRLLHAPQLGYNALGIEHRVGVADAPAEVGFEVADGLGRGDEVESGGCGEARAVFG